MSWFGPDVTEILGALAERVTALELKAKKQDEEIEQLRLSPSKGPVNQPAALELDSNWHIRKRQIERENAKQSDVA